MLGVSFLQPTHSYPETDKKKEKKIVVVEQRNNVVLKRIKKKKKKLEQEYTKGENIRSQPHSFNPASL